MCRCVLNKAVLLRRSSKAEQEKTDKMLIKSLEREEKERKRVCTCLCLSFALPAALAPYFGKQRNDFHGHCKRWRHILYADTAALIRQGCMVTP